MKLQQRVQIVSFRSCLAILFSFAAFSSSARAEFIGVDFGPGSSTPTNWNTLLGGAPPLPTLENLMDETGALTAVDLVLSTTDLSFSTSNGSPPAGELPTRYPTLDGIEGNLFTSTNATYTFQDLDPLGFYNVWVFSLDTISSTNDVTITGDVVQNFTETHNTNQLVINGTVGSSANGLEAYQITLPADSTGAISIDINATSGDTGVGGLAIAPVSELIGIDFGPGSSTPNNWNVFSGTSPVNNLTNEAGDVTSVGLTATTPASGSFNTASSNPPANQIPAHSQSLAGVESNTYVSGTPGQATYTLNNLVPYHTYQVNVLSADTISGNTTDVTIAGHGSPAAFQVSFDANELYVNDAIGDSTKTLDSYALTVAANAAGQIVIDTEAISGDAGIAGVTATPNAALVGIDFGGASPTNWNSGTTGFTTSTNMIDETGAQTAIDLTYTGASLNIATGSPPAGQFPAHGQSLANLSGNIFASAPGTFTFSDLDPLKAYEIWVFGLDTFSSTMDVTITGDGAPINYQNAYNSNNLYVNGVLGDSTETLADTALIVNASSVGEISIDLVDVGSYWGLAGLAIREYVPLSVDFAIGDLNLDGFVDALDFGTLAANFGVTGLGYYDGNINGDLYVDAADIGIMFGSWTGDTGSVGAAVPEPASLLLMGLAGVLLGSRRRRA